MKINQVLFFVPMIMLCGCKQAPEASNSKIDLAEPELKIENLASPILKELERFAAHSSDTTTLKNSFSFIEIDKNGELETVDANRAIDLYEKMMRREEAISWPIFEIKDTDTVLLLVQGIGFGGPIWAKVLVGKASLEIIKIEFDHTAESDGYGAAIIQSSFEERFVGTKINLEKNTFTLQENMEKRMDDGVIVDGISGATMTSKAALEMVNEGLKKYGGYLNP